MIKSFELCKGQSDTWIPHACASSPTPTYTVVRSTSESCILAACKTRIKPRKRPAVPVAFCIHIHPKNRSQTITTFDTAHVHNISTSAQQYASCAVQHSTAQHSTVDAWLPTFGGIIRSHLSRLAIYYLPFISGYATSHHPSVMIRSLDQLYHQSATRYRYITIVPLISTTSGAARVRYMVRIVL